MTDADVGRLLKELGARDITDGLQGLPADDDTAPDDTDPDDTAPRVYEPYPPSMWHLDRQNITVETKYHDGKLSILNVWDWSEQEFRRYHHMHRYDEVSKLQIGPGAGYETTVIKTVPAWEFRNR